MKASFLILSVSLAANVLGIWLWWRSEPTPSAAQAADTPAPSARSQSAGRSKTTTAALTTERAPKTRVQEFLAQRDRLRELGFPEDIVRRVIRAAMEEPRLARQREFYAQASQQPWWRGGAASQNITKEQQRELHELRKLERDEILQVLGPAALVQDANLARYSFLPTEKAERLVLLEQDYNDLRAEARLADNPKDVEERQKLLDAEYERDLAALLSPEERAAHDEREAQSARSIATRFEFFDATEAEYRAVLALQKDFDAQFQAGRSTRAGAAERLEAQSKLEADLQAAFGAERYEQFLQSQRSEYRALVELQRRHALPPAVFEQAARAQAAISRETNRIADDPALNAGEKRAALIALSGKAIADMQAALGPALAETFIAATRASWIDVLARGGAYQALPTGGERRRTFNNPPPPAPKS